MAHKKGQGSSRNGRDATSAGQVRFLNRGRHGRFISIIAN